RPAAAEREATLEPDIHPMQRRADEVVTWHDAARRTLGVRSGAQAGTIPASIGGCKALARAVKIQPTHLEAVPGVPDSVENSAVPLVGGRQSILRSCILGQLNPCRANGRDGTAGRIDRSNARRWSPIFDPRIL